jgi:hypothetical protein
MMTSSFALNPQFLQMKMSQKNPVPGWLGDFFMLWHNIFEKITISGKHRNVAIFSKI